MCQVVYCANCKKPKKYVGGPRTQWCKPCNKKRRAMKMRQHRMPTRTAVSIAWDYFLSIESGDHERVARVHHTAREILY